MNRKTFKYKEFYLSICKTKNSYIGYLYSKRFNNSKEVYYPKIITYEFVEEKLLTTMKKEVDKFLIRYKEYLSWKIENLKEQLSDKINDLNFIEQSLKE